MNWPRLETITAPSSDVPYIHRWHLFRCPWFRVYLHHIIDADWSEDAHDHPRSFMTIGLRGWYSEAIYADGLVMANKTYIAPWLRRFPADHAHRIYAVCPQGVWTIAVVGPYVRDWGYWLGADWMPSREYFQCFRRSN